MPTRTYTLACTDGHKQLVLMPKTEINYNSSPGTKSNHYEALAHITSFWISSGRGPAVKQIFRREADGPFISLFLHLNLQQLSRIHVKQPFLRERGSLLRPVQRCSCREHQLSVFTLLLSDSMKLTKSQMFSFRRNLKMKLMILWCTENVLSALTNWIGQKCKMYKICKATLLSLFLKWSLKDTRTVINLETHLLHFTTFRQKLAVTLTNLGRHLKQLLFLFPLTVGLPNQVLLSEILNHLLLLPLDFPVKYLQLLNP